LRRWIQSPNVGKHLFFFFYFDWEVSPLMLGSRNLFFSQQQTLKKPPRPGKILCTEKNRKSFYESLENIRFSWKRCYFFSNEVNELSIANVNLGNVSLSLKSKPLSNVKTICVIYHYSLLSYNQKLFLSNVKNISMIYRLNFETST
jgi:hypothetical protein